jgi:hypothetical protein
MVFDWAAARTAGTAIIAATSTPTNRFICVLLLEEKSRHRPARARQARKP